MSFAEKYNSPNDRFLQHFSTKNLHLRVELLMSAQKFSSKNAETLERTRVL